MQAPLLTALAFAFLTTAEGESVGDTRKSASMMPVLVASVMPLLQPYDTTN